MNIEETLTVNTSLREGGQIPCSTCIGKTYHEILVSVDKEGNEWDEDGDFHWESHYQIVQCMGCKTISFRETNSNSNDCEQLSHCQEVMLVHEKIYPPRIQGRKGLGDSLYHLPEKVRAIYSETLQALNSNSPILTGIGLRALVETVCKEKQADGKNLADKLDALQSRDILTATGTKILHEIRTMGNEAAHEVKPHTTKQLAVGMDVVEHLLTDVYILPQKVAVEFKKSIASDDTPYNFTPEDDF